MSEYTIKAAALDMSVAYKCEADRAEKEGFKGVAKRQRDMALHIENAIYHMQKHCPDGYRIETNIVVSYVPDVNAYLQPEFRK